MTFFDGLEKKYGRYAIRDLMRYFTVLYALGKKHIDVSINETTTDDPYNTYKNEGLPPGPICATLAETVEDCINYEDSDYLFFFATEDGTVLYTKTYEEHQKVVKENKWY